MSETSKSGVSKWLGGAVVLILAYFGYDQVGGKTGDTTSNQSPSAEQSTPAENSRAEAPQKAPPKTVTPKASTPKVETPPANTVKPKPAPKPTKTTLMVRGPSGRSIDIFPTIDRIQKGISHSHRNDGSVFQNRERRLPQKKRGYYREYVHPTPGQRGPGAQRVVIGKEGEVFYTADHYKSFKHVPHKFKLEEKGGR